MCTSIRVLRLVGGVFSLYLMVWAAAAAEPSPSPTIANESLAVSVDSEGRLTLEAVAPRLALGELRFPDRVAPQASDWNDAVLGSGRGLRLQEPSANWHEVVLIRGLPFALVRSHLVNRTEKKIVLDRAPGPRLALSPTLPAAHGVTMGTGGLRPAEKNPGSYLWQAVADPASGSGVVLGWLTQEQGCGVVFTPTTDGAIALDTRLDFGRLGIAPGRDVTLDWLAVGYFADARLGLEAWAALAARLQAISLPPQPAGYCTWYAEKHGGAGDQASTAELADFAQQQLAPWGMHFIQIDDLWQNGSRRNGPAKDFTTHKPNGPYPSGMQPMAKTIARHGFTPGLWFMPFAGDHEDPLFTPHLDFFAKGPDGRPFETRWGGTCLDMTYPPTREFVRSVCSRIAHDWGYRYVKLDGLWTGSATRLMYVNDAYKDDAIGEAQLHDMDLPHVAAMRSGLRLVREAVGPQTFILGCCAPQNMRSYAGALGLVDAMRIGPDNNAAKGLVTGIDFGSRNYFLNGRVWWNDPDPVYVRPSVPLEQARMICSWVQISGQLFAMSDWLPGLPAERLEILRRTIAPHGQPARPVDYFEHSIPRLWTFTAGPRQIVGCFNPTAEPLSMDVKLPRLGLAADRAYDVFDFWEQSFQAQATGAMKVYLPPMSCRVFALRAAEDRPTILSSSRHLSQGLLDLSPERWDAPQKTLSVRVALLPDDPDEIRLTYPPEWTLDGATLDPADVAAGVKLSVQRVPRLARLKLESPRKASVDLRVRFRRHEEMMLPLTAASDLAGHFVKGRVQLTWTGAFDGRLFEIARDGQVLDVTTQEHWTDATPTEAATHQYTVTTLDLWGHRGAATTTSVTIPRKVIPALGPRPPKPTVSLTTLKPLSARVGWGKLGMGVSVSGGPLSIAGQRYTDGLGVHAAARVIFERKKEWTRFVAVGGLDDAKKDDARQSVVLRVIADNGEAVAGEAVLAESPVLQGPKTRLWHFDVPLPESCRRLILEVDDAGDGIACDHADWVDAGFLTK